MKSDLWSVVLAAGSGRRLAAMTGGTPKQFWQEGGQRSLLDNTLARLAPLAPPERTTVVIDRMHRRFVPHGTGAWPAQWIVHQPEDRGTAAGVLLALTPVLDAEPDAIAVVTPSDHGVADTAIFREGLLDAASAVRSGCVRAVVFGVTASQPTPDYGWICPGASYDWAPPDGSLRRVEAFVEKPTHVEAIRLFSAGALWNTMVVVSRASALLDMYRGHLPDWAGTFVAYRDLAHHNRDRYLASRYAVLPPADFSRDILTAARDLSVYSWDDAIGWSDLGTPHRWRQWHQCAGPSLSEALADVRAGSVTMRSQIGNDSHVECADDIGPQWSER